MPLEIQQLNSAFGAEIRGVDLGDRLDSEATRRIREVFDEKGVIVFRGVSIDRPYQYYLSDVLRGSTPPSEHEAREGAARQGTFTISNKEDGAAAPFGRLLYHCDGMWSGEPFEVLSLYGVTVGQPAVPTWFANAAHAWEVLPDDLRRRVADLHAVQVTGPEYIHERRRGAFDGELIQGRRENPPSTVTPVAYVHPRTGRTFLCVMQGMTRNIAELSWDESEDLLEELFACLYHPEAIYAHEWREGDLVLWDNLFIQHGRPNVSTSGPPRTLQKIGLPMPTDVSAHLIDSYEDVVS